MDVISYVLLGVGALVAILLLFFVKWIFSLRRVVPPNEVHVVRQGKKTLTYGSLEDSEDADKIADTSAGNAYYEWPVWIPVLGVTKQVLPLSNFDIWLKAYNAYDKDRVPFSVDIQAFFRISNYKIAAARIKDFSELKTQLSGILQGASRSLLANEVLESIMGERAEYGGKFTANVKDQLANWGVQTVKNIELMDIRDAEGENVIENIMEKRKSEIAKESRIKVAENNQAAEEAEIAAQQVIDLRREEAREAVGKRNAEVEARVGIEKEKAQQSIKEEAKVTKEREMAVLEIEKTRQAEIDQKSRTIAVETAKKEIQIQAEAEKEKLALESAGKLTEAENKAKGIEAIGQAEATAEEKRQMASVTAQTALAKEIGENSGYQEYLVKKQQIEANERVGLKQAENLSGADIKIIANSSDVNQGVSQAAGTLSPKGGFGIATMLETLASTEEGKKLLDAVQSFLTKKNED